MKFPVFLLDLGSFHELRVGREYIGLWCKSMCAFLNNFDCTIDLYLMSADEKNDFFG